MIVEHHREVIALADHIVDMGPEAGINGGQIMYQEATRTFWKADTVTGADAADENADEDGVPQADRMVSGRAREAS